MRTKTILELYLSNFISVFFHTKATKPNFPPFSQTATPEFDILNPFFYSAGTTNSNARYLVRFAAYQNRVKFCIFIKSLDYC
ncbi:hypothetical protein CAMRE0001_3249 [Campylobacter rectus RM3267]|uniref:Uncharacterized protein n=1 Tax=Campylobacter rectus RM3267 TaxID=553218 RepID=B9D507_CAMRE|nr:hypothetical protein CAMRE0001_3249 [Campylobacter rectus RM3267]